jgi:hypothetical protein
LGKKDEEWKRGAKDASRLIDEVLRVLWPDAFPRKAADIRPLADDASTIAAALGWSPHYTKGVLSVWKSREGYCRAILKHTDRVSLIDGSVITYCIDNNVRLMALTRLKQIAAKKAKAAKRAKAAKKREAGAGGVDLVIEADGQTAFIRAKAASGPTIAAEPAHDLVVTVGHHSRAAPVDAPPALPLVDELPRERKLIVASSAAKEALLKRAGGAMTTEVVATIPPRRR